MCLRHLIRQDKPKKLVYQINEVKDFVLICLNRCSFCLFFFQTKQDLQRRKEEMAQAVEATRKRLEAVSTAVLY